MKIKFSRHAKRRGKLYKISERTIKEILEKKKLIQGNQEIVEYVRGFKYPLKIVVSVEDDIVTVITSYPVKKGRKK
ncbi:MAG: DUF4258 domain-containing protein [Candidatus Marinimicrobia bacterium]|nr:DUF4258 domain-containing protein [Candidatus Neomarinimicrobiota bacterium]